MPTNREPKTLQEAIVYFSNPDNCLSFLVAHRWPDGKVTCPTCGSDKVSFLKNQNRWQCSSRHPKRQFSIKVGTIFEDSPIGLDKWLCAMWMVANCKNGVSSHELARTLGVTQKSAWFMLHRIRLAMQSDKGGKLGGGSGEVEVDESFIGGKARNMHKVERKKKIRGSGGFDNKAIAFGMVERGGELRAFAVDSRKKVELQKLIREQIESGSFLFSDELRSYIGLHEDYFHQVIDHAIEYVNGNVHTNTLENFWSLLKRAIKGTYVNVEPFHLFRYLDEQAFRWNLRKNMKDGDRFGHLVRSIVGKRLTYEQLTGKMGQASPAV